MTKHLEREIERLKKLILGLSTAVEECVHKAIRAVDERDEALATEIIEGDVQIDAMEVEVEEECLKVLALHQPVAIDLRFIIAVLKINNDLERIGDLGVNIASRAKALSHLPATHESFDFAAMMSGVKEMLRKSLESLVHLNVPLAWEVCRSDEKIDEMNREMFQALQDGMKRHPQDQEALVHLLSVSRNLERMADHTTNIAEDVIYMIDGEIVRHRPPNN